MVENLSQLGIETEFLTGDRNWLFDGLDELYAQFEALDTYYNKGIGAAAANQDHCLRCGGLYHFPVKEDPEIWLLIYLDLMKDAW